MWKLFKNGSFFPQITPPKIPPQNAPKICPNKIPPVIISGGGTYPLSGKLLKTSGPKLYLVHDVQRHAKPCSVHAYSIKRMRTEYVV